MKRKFTLIILTILTLLITQTSIDIYADGEPCVDGKCLLNAIYQSGFGVPTNLFHDNSPAIWVGGNFTVDPLVSEIEGLTVVLGDMLVKTNAPSSDKSFGVGTVGGGSGIVPDFDGVMLAVGGELVAEHPKPVHVGPTLGPLGTPTAVALIGKEVIGDVTAACSKEDHAEDDCYILDELGDAAVDYWSWFRGELRDESSHPIYGLSEMEQTGDVAFTSGSWASLEFKSTNPSAPMQVFEVTTKELNSFEENVTIHFVDIPILEDGRFNPIVINVVIDEDEDVHLNQVHNIEINGVQVNAFISDDYGNAASAILWNFVDVKNIVIGGADQFLGSIIAPYSENVDIKTSTNGRLYVNGNLTFSGDGMEHHNFPWTGSSWFGCNHDEIPIPTESGEPLPGGGECECDEDCECEEECECGEGVYVDDDDDDDDPDDSDDDDDLSGPDGAGGTGGTGGTGSTGSTGGTGDTGSTGGTGDTGGLDDAGNPANPVVPDNPVAPANPVVLANPVIHDEPNDSDGLDGPNEWEIPGSFRGVASLPSTGADSYGSLWLIGLCFVALLCITSACLLLQRKANRRRFNECEKIVQYIRNNWA